jgi:hypothetical protein
MLCSVTCHLVSGEKLALWISSRTQKGLTVADPESAPTTAGRTGVAIGILVVTLLVLAFYFYWRTTGARDETGRRPQAREVSAGAAASEASTLMG